MRMQVVVEDTDQFQAWVKQQQAPLPAMTGDLANGYQLFMNNGCFACHTLQGTDAQGKVGPDLTHFASRQTLAGGILDNPPDNLTTWLANPQAVKPGTQMPDLGLSADKIAALVAFLEALK